eukprot:1151806-Pelagomonas_calceolata.AAC.2
MVALYKRITGQHNSVFRLRVRPLHCRNGKYLTVNVNNGKVDEISVSEESTESKRKLLSSTGGVDEAGPGPRGMSPVPAAIIYARSQNSKKGPGRKSGQFCLLDRQGTKTALKKSQENFIIIKKNIVLVNIKLGT